MSDSLRPHGLPHASFPCPPLSPGFCSSSFLLSQWSYLTISSSAALFSFCFQSSPNIRVFSSESTLHFRWPRFWSFSVSISHSREYSGSVSFRIDWWWTLQCMCLLELPWFSQGICPVVGFLGHMVALFLVFKWTSMLFSIVTVSIYKWIKKMWYLYTIEYYTAIKRNKIASFIAM